MGSWELGRTLFDSFCGNTRDFEKDKTGQLCHFLSSDQKFDEETTVGQKLLPSSGQFPDADPVASGALVLSGPSQVAVTSGLLRSPWWWLHHSGSAGEPGLVEWSCMFPATKAACGCQSKAAETVPTGRVFGSLSALTSLGLTVQFYLPTPG